MEFKNYGEMVQAAEALAIATNGIRKPQLQKLLDEKIAEIGEDKFSELFAAHQVSAGAAAGATVTAEAAAATPRQKAPKWFEEQGFAYKDGDVIKITAGKVLVGRLAVVNKPSAKKEAVKAFLFHEKTGELQKTNITVDYANCEPAQQSSDEVKTAILDAVTVKEQERKNKQAAAQQKRDEAKAAKEAAKNKGEVTAEAATA